MPNRLTTMTVGPLPQVTAYQGPLPPGQAYASGPTVPMAPAYQAAPDQLYLSNGYAAPSMPTAAPIGGLSLLSGLLQRLQDLVHRLFSSPSAPPVAPPAARATDFVISSFNVLGNSHTAPGGNKPGWAPGVERIRAAARMLDAHHVGVVGFQEFQGPQIKEFLKIAGDKYAVYPGLAHGESEAENSIAWRKDTWELVKPGSVSIPYFEGHVRKMPVLLLRNRQTGQEAYFINVHNPADTRDHHGQERWRDEATRREVDLVNRLRRETGLPVFVTGDMNEKTEAFDHFTRGTDLESSNEGPNGKLPKQVGIDWIFGSPEVHFSGYERDNRSITQRTSDHPMIVSRARIG